MTSYFASKGHQCPAHYNPADYVMFLMQTKSQNVVEGLADAWSDEETNAIAQVLNSIPPENLQASKASNATKAGFCMQFQALIIREFQQVLRDKAGMAARIGTTLFLNLIVAFVFQDAANWSGV